MTAALQGVHKLAFLLRRHTAKNRAGLCRLGQRLLAAQRCGIHPAFRPGNARVSRHMADRLRVIARDNLDGHPLLGEIAEGLGGVLSDAVLHRQQRQKFKLRCVQCGGRVRQCRVVLGQQQHAAALCQQRRKHIGKFRRPASGQHVRRADHIAPMRPKVLGAVLVRRVEGDAAHRKPRRAPLPEARCQGAARVVVGLLPRVKSRQNLADRRIFRQRQRVISLHRALGNRAGLVHAEHIHPGQRLDAVHIPGQHLAAGQPHHAHRQRHAGQQIEPLRYHTNQGGNRRIHGLLHREPQHPVLLPNQHRANRNQRHTDEFYQLIQAAHHLAAGHLVAVGLRLGGQLAGIALGSHVGQPRRAAPRHQEAARAQLCAALLRHRPCFAGDERFIGLRAAVHHHGIRHNLVARAKLHHIILDQIIGQHGAPLTVPQAAHLPRRNQRQLVDGLFGAQLLHNADEGVPEHNPQKPHIEPRVHQRQHDRQHQKHQIEIGTDIVPHNLPGGSGLGLGRPVCLARRTARFDLGSGQAGDGCHRGNSFRVELGKL